MKKGIFLVFALMILASPFAFALDTPLAQIVPVESEWNADGETIYQVDYFLDTRGTATEVWAIDASIVLPDYLNLVSYTDYDGESSEFPDYPNPDFFDSSNMIFEDANLRQDHFLAGRSSWIGINDKLGKVASFWFTVDQDAPLGDTSIAFWNPNQIGDDEGQPLPLNLEVVPFTIVDPNASSCPADFNGDGFVNGADLANLLSAWGTAGADLTSDNLTNGADLANLLSNWGDCNGAVSGDVNIDKDSRELLSNFLAKQNKRALSFLNLVL